MPINMAKVFVGTGRALNAIGSMRIRIIDAPWEAVKQAERTDTTSGGVTKPNE